MCVVGNFCRRSSCLFVCVDTRCACSGCVLSLVFSASSDLNAVVIGPGGGDYL